MLEFLPFIAGSRIACTAEPALPCPDRWACVAQSDTPPLWASTQPRFSHREHTDT